MHVGLIGFGVLGRQIKSMYESMYGKDVKFRFYDDVAFASKIDNAFPFKHWVYHDNIKESYIVALGYKHLGIKCSIIKKLRDAECHLETYIHPTAFVNPAAIVHGGSVVYPMSNVDTGVVLGYGVLLNNSVVISHDSSIGDGCFIAPGVIISGNVHIGSGSFIGSGSTISNGVTIGNSVTVGVGSCITHDIKDGEFVIGNPARRIAPGFLLK